MRKLKHHVLISVKKIKNGLKPQHVVRSYLHQNVPYFSQWESRKLNRTILKKEINATDDPKWKASGAQTKEEYAIWSSTGCGMACLKMILAHQTGEIIPLVTLGKRCVDYGGYSLPLEQSAGLRYVPSYIL